MALGVEGMRAGKVVRKAIFLTLGTAIFIFCLTLVYESMRAVMDVGGACASGGAYEIRQACPKGVGWTLPVGILGMFFAGIFTFLGVFDEGGPRPYVFAWSALFLALGWNFLDYGFDKPARRHRGRLADLRVRVRGHGWRAAPLPAVAARGALVAVGSELAAGRRLPPPVQAAAPARRRPRRAAAATRRARRSPLPRLRRRPGHRSPGHRCRRSTCPDPVPDAVVPEDEPSTPKGDVVEQLETLADLRERGMLDEDEYEKAKHAVLGEDGAS